MSRPWAVFLDRDGTLLRLVPYLHEPDRARLHAGVGRALRALRAAGARLVLVTNQSGVARGLFTMGQVRSVNVRLARLLAKEGVRLDAVEICPHHPEYGGPCGCRKPAPGMLRRAARRLGVDLSRSWTIGDTPADLQAGRAAGTRSALVLTGYGRRTRRELSDAEFDLVAATLPALVDRLIARKREEENGRKGPVRRTTARGRKGDQRSVSDGWGGRSRR